MAQKKVPKPVCSQQISRWRDGTSGGEIRTRGETVTNGGAHRRKPSSIAHFRHGSGTRMHALARPRDDDDASPQRLCNRCYLAPQTTILLTGYSCGLESIPTAFCWKLRRLQGHSVVAFGV